MGLKFLGSETETTWCNSMIYGAVLSGALMSIATPKGLGPDKNVVKESKKTTAIEVTTDPLVAIKDADVVVTDTFTSIHNLDPNRMKRFIPKYQINESLMKNAKKDAIFMHLPSGKAWH